ncbi:CD4-1 molecule isoform X2 [Xiphias gladius]|uniref:CD4-1 molecule isoform X2 n=1 Tax=Xiphias gladius TaxID=8245 RepID=UPI001A98A896|nr:CD4-1 molecule isoform X2 [Xiphias gladius]
MKNSIQSILILITVLISTTGADEVVYAQVGETVTLKGPGVTYQLEYMYWKFGNQNGPLLAWCNHLGGERITEDTKWKDKLAWSDNSLIIKDIQQENLGTFVREIIKSQTSNFFLITVLKLNVSVNPPSPLLPGENLSLACSVETPQNLEKPKIHWLTPWGENLEMRQETRRVTSKDNGQWTCVVTADQKEKQTKVSVTVLDLSPAPLRPQYTSKSMPLTIPCSIPPHISWEQIKAKGFQEVVWQFSPKSSLGLIHDSETQKLYVLSLERLRWNKTDQHRELKPVQDPQKRNLTLTRKQGRKEDRGDYMCIMKFKNGVTLSRTVHVEVLQIIPSPGTDLISGQPLNLTCSLSHPLPSDLHLQWSPPKQSSLPKSDHYQAHLTIPEVGTGDGGNWECSLWQGKTQLTSASITLKIEHKLSVWMLVIICSVAVIAILLLILVFILYRHRQRRVRHLRHRLCQCKNPKPKGFYRT